MYIFIYIYVDGDPKAPFSGRIIPKTQKMVLDSTQLNTQHYKVRIKGKVEQSREWSRAFHYTSIEKGVFGSPSTKVGNFS